MAMLFQACQNSSAAFIQPKRQFIRYCQRAGSRFLHHKYLSHVVSELKPDLTEIIKQGIQNGEIHFDYPAALAEIVLIVIAVKLDNSLLPSTPKETEETLKGLISLLEKGRRSHPERSAICLWCPLYKTSIQSSRGKIFPLLACDSFSALSAVIFSPDRQIHPCSHPRRYPPPQQFADIFKRSLPLYALSLTISPNSATATAK